MTTPACGGGCRLVCVGRFRGTTNATEAGALADDQEIFIGPASPSDVAEGFPWRWVVSYLGERRSGACVTHEQAQREAEIVLKLLKERL
jgi:hypothetical protein